MNGERLKQRIIEASKRLGIDKIGFTTAEDFSELEESLREQRAKGFASGFEHSKISERVAPSKIFHQPKSILSIALAYPTRGIKKVEKTKEKRGKISRASWGLDYHHILNQKLQQLVEKIKEFVSEACAPKFKCMVDTGELVDVAVAQRAGVGFIGKNGLLITEEFGSFVYLGEIITNLELPPDKPLTSQCGACVRCIDNCPSNALLGDGTMNAKRCLSYQTQSKELIPEEFRKLMRTTIYGCDICQLVCPFNKGKDFHFHPQMEPDVEEVEPVLKPLLKLTNREFQERFRKMAASWRGKNPLQRNAVIALVNHHDFSAISDLLEVIAEHSSAVVRATAAWGVGQLVNQPTSEMKEVFLQAMKKETAADVIREFQQVLERWK